MDVGTKWIAAAVLRYLKPTIPQRSLNRLSTTIAEILDIEMKTVDMNFIAFLPTIITYFLVSVRDFQIKRSHFDRAQPQDAGRREWPG